MRDQSHTVAKQALLLLVLGWLAVVALHYAEQSLYAWHQQQSLVTAPRLIQVVGAISQAPQAMELERAKRLLYSVDTATLPPQQWRLWLRTMGDALSRTLIYAEPHLYERQFAYAMSCYRQALTGETVPVRQRLVQLRIARLHMQHRQWLAAANQFAAIHLEELGPDQQAEVYLQWGECLRLAGDPRGALARLDTVISQGHWQRRQQAMVAKLQLVLHLAEALPAEHPGRLVRQQEAGRLLEQLALMPDIPFAARRVVDLGRCRQARLNGDYETLVREVNSLYLTGAAAAFKLQSLAVLSQAMQERGEWRDAGFVMEACLDDFRGRPEAGALLADLLIAQLDQLPAVMILDLCNDMLQHFDNPDDLRRIFEAMVAPESGFDKRLSVADNEAAAQAIQALEARLQAQQDPAWEPVLGFYWYVAAKVALHRRDFALVESCLARFLVAVPDSPHRADAIYMDLDAAAQRAEPDPAILALRAARLLNTYPDHPQASAALHELAYAYHAMSLKRESLEVVKRSFLQSVVHLTEQREALTEVRWLRTIGDIITGYASLGYSNKADRLFKMYSPYLINLPDSGQVLAAAASCAVEAGQLQEAIRRYDLSIPRCQDPELALRFQVSRLTLALQVDNPGAVSETETLLAEMRHLPTAERDRRSWAILELQHHLLSYLENRDFQQLMTVMEDVFVPSGAESWFSAWVLRVMWQDLQSQDLASWRTRYDQLIDTSESRPRPDALTTAFVQRQVDLIEGLIAVNQRLEILEQRGRTP